MNIWLRRRVRVSPSISVSRLTFFGIPLIAIASICLIWRGIFGSASPASVVSFRPPYSSLRPPFRTFKQDIDRPFVYGCKDPDTSQPRANAVLVVLARNKELDGVVQSMKSIERHFNRWFHYPYVFLNDVDFNKTFMETVANHTESKIEFGRIDPAHWGFPPDMDKDYLKEEIKHQGDRAIMYGGLESYHHMCRFYSGFFFRHPLLQKYDWYWRVEPEITYFCDITYDPFIYMERHNKVYGFTIAIRELVETVPDLFRYTKGFKKTRNINTTSLWPMFVVPTDEDQDVPEDILKLDTKKKQEIDPEAMDREKYNMCHFWSNFEIARLDFYRSQEYTDYFNYLDKTGGFWTQRWGDAPVHSLAAGLLLDANQVHYFRDIGYRHTTIQHCPDNAPGKQLPHTPYFQSNRREDRNEEEFWSTYDEPQPGGIGCRCKCDYELEEVEQKDGSCLSDWIRVMGGYTDRKEEEKKNN